MNGPADLQQALTEAHQRDWGTVLAATLRTVRDIDLAEECLQEAYVEAMEAWARIGIPANPTAWLTTTARRRGIDALRRRATLRAKLPLLLVAEEAEDDWGRAGGRDLGGPEVTIADELLRLIFMCCHPALAPEAQLALTLRLVCGMSTTDIARSLLVSEPTMAARMTRAKRKIAAARIPVRVPAADDLPERLETVLGVIHLLFTMGHTAPSGRSLMRSDLVDRSVRLARVLRQLMPEAGEVQGLLALLLVTDARRATRVDARGRPLRLAEQDRSRWDRAAIAEAHGLIQRGLEGGRPGRYVLQAAIASLHAEAGTFEETDWPQIVHRYDQLLSVWPSPVVALNRAVALSMVEGPAVALRLVEQLEREGQLDRYHYLYVVKADLLHRLGRDVEAATADRLAIQLVANDAERSLLEERLNEWGGASSAGPGDN